MQTLPTFNLDSFRVLGISHQKAPVALREKLAVLPGQLAEALSRMRRAGAREAVLLSTCNRVEAYWSAPEADAAGDRLLADWEKSAGQSLRGIVFRLQGVEAARHLFRVAAGLESMVLGETQILGQVKAAYAAASEQGLTGSLTNKLFQRAIHAGKKVRTDTAIASGITSISSAAVALAGKIFPDLSRCGVMILGAGKVAEAAARHLASQKTHAMFVSNRTYERAKELAVGLNAEALHWEEGMDRIAEVDIVIASTACPVVIVDKARVEGWMKTRGGRPLFIIDLAVPRDVDPSVGEVPGVHLYEIDDLRQVVEAQAGRKTRDAARAESILETLLQDLCGPLQSPLAPVLA